MKASENLRMVVCSVVLAATVAAYGGYNNPHDQCVGQEDTGGCTGACDDQNPGERDCVEWSPSTQGCRTCVIFRRLGWDSCTVDPVARANPANWVPGSYALCNCLPSSGPLGELECTCSTEGCQGPFNVLRPCDPGC